MRTSKVKPKNKFKVRPKFIEASFKRKGQLDKSLIIKELNNQRLIDYYHSSYIGQAGVFRSNPQAMFTSCNSHKQTNKRKS